MTGAPGRSALVAALFALHPLHVESVAWIAERKDVLSTLFGLLTLWAYGRHVERSAKLWHWGSLVLFSLGFMSKPMLVTLPFILLLLDYWPLKSWAWPPTAASCRRKLLPAAASDILTRCLGPKQIEEMI